MQNRFPALPCSASPKVAAQQLLVKYIVDIIIIHCVDAQLLQVPAQRQEGGKVRQAGASQVETASHQRMACFVLFVG